MTYIHTVTIDHGDQLVEHCYAANAPEHGILVCGIAPEMRRALPLIQDLLAALGCRDDVAGTGRNVTKDTENLIAWILAHPIRHIVLIDAQWLASELLELAIHVAAAADAELWLVCHRPIERAWERTIAAWPTIDCAPDELATTLDQQTPVEAENDVELFPRLNDAPWMTFRANCRDTLTSDEFSTVDARYCDAVQAGLNQFESSALTEDLVLGHLKERCDGAATFDEMIVEARAAQVAAWRHGWHVQIDINQFSAVANTTPTRRQLNNPAWWRRLSVYAEPWRGATCALAATGLGCTRMTDLTLADVDDNGNARDPDTRTTLDVPAGGRMYLRAQHSLRIMHGARPSDPLFVVDDEKPARDRRLAQALLDAQLECGVNVTGGRIARGDTTKAAWVSRLGVAVQPLEKRQP